MSDPFSTSRASSSPPAASAAERRARAAAAPRLPPALPRGRRERARRLAALHRADVVRARRGRPARRRRGAARGQRARARLRPARRAGRRPVEPAAADDRRGPRPRRRRSCPVAIAGLAGDAAALGARRRGVPARGGDELLRARVRRDVPALVDRANVQQANALVQATAQALSIGGWAVAAALLAVLPVSVFFAVNAVSFVVSAAADRAASATAASTSRTRAPPRLARASRRCGRGRCSPPASSCSASRSRSRPGTWIGGVPTLVRDTLHHGAGGFSIVMVGYAAGSIASGVAARARCRSGARRAPACSPGCCTSRATG